MKQFFETHPVFRYEEFTRFMAERGINKPTTCRQQLSYHYKQGHLIRTRRSLYAVKPFLFSEEKNWIDPLSHCQQSYSRWRSWLSHRIRIA